MGATDSPVDGAGRDPEPSDAEIRRHALNRFLRALAPYTPDGLTIEDPAIGELVAATDALARLQAIHDYQLSMDTLAKIELRAKYMKGEEPHLRYLALIKERQAQDRQMTRAREVWELNPGWSDSKVAKHVWGELRREGVPGLPETPRWIRREIGKKRP